MENTIPGFTKFDSAYQDDATGEMWVPASDGSDRLIPTGKRFYVVTQSLPSLQNLEARTPGHRISPWAFADMSTAASLVRELSKMVPGDVKVTIVPADRNNQFPHSHEQWQIQFSRGDRKARVNAGLIASNIARGTAFINGSVYQPDPRPYLEFAVTEAMVEIERPVE